MEYTAIIIDDEKMARVLLKGLLERFCPEVKVLEECPDLPCGVKAIHQHKPNIVFLDIEMPGHSGLELLDFFDESAINFSIIFTTAYHQYAIKAFKLSAIDYLLKPIDSQDLIQAVSTFKKQHTKQNFAILKENLNPGSKKQKLAINYLKSIKYVELDTIVYFKADGAYTDIYMEDGTLLKTSKGLKYYQDILNHNEDFCRIHKSYYVNLNFVSELIKTDGGYLVLQNEHIIPISAEKLVELNLKLDNYLM